MVYISFAIALIGVAGMVGGIEIGSMTGFILSTAIYTCGVAGMAAITKKEIEREKEADEEQEDNSPASGGGSTVDKPSCTCRGGQTEDR